MLEFGALDANEAESNERKRFGRIDLIKSLINSIGLRLHIFLK